MASPLRHGLLIDFAWCTGCHSCTIAGRNANDLDYTQSCITVGSEQRWENGRLMLYFVPAPTDLCNLCGSLTAQGKDPACVHHCPPRVLTYGTRAELEEALERKPGQTLWFPGAPAG